MTTSTCKYCGGTFAWFWIEAFDKFGFNDGDGTVMTEAVADALRDAGYVVSVQPWGLHNEVITSIKKDGVEQIPETANIGYDEPRDYLPQEIIDLLDAAFPDTGEVQS